MYVKFLRIILTCVLVSLALGGCATFSQDGGFGGVKKASAEHIKQEIAWPKTEVEQKAVADRIAELLKTPLNADSAVQLALLNNKDLQA